MTPHPVYITVRRLCMCGVTIFSLVTVSAHGTQVASFNSTVSSIQTVVGKPFFVTYKLEYPQYSGHRKINATVEYPCDREWIFTAEVLHYVDRLIWTEKNIRFRIIPHQPGVILAGAADAYVNRAKMRCEGHEVTVLPTGSHPDEDPSLSTHRLLKRDGMITVEATVSDATVYAGQPLVYDVLVYDDVFDTDVKIDMPDFKGFWTHDVDDPSETQVDHNGSDVWCRTERTILYPIDAGTYQIPAARIAYHCHKPSYVQYGTLWTHSLRIRALPMPVEGRPDIFTGAVGDYQLSLHADNDSLTTGDLLTVTMRMEGEGAIDMIADVPRPDFSGFLVIRSTYADTLRSAGMMAGGVKEWRYTLRADQVGEHCIGPVSFAYFNPWRKRYEYARTQAVTVRIGHTEGSISEDEPEMDMKIRHTGFHQDIHYIKPDKSELGNISPIWHRRGYWSLYLLPSVAWFLILSYRNSFTFRRNVSEWIQDKRAVTTLSHNLDRAERLCSDGDTDSCRKVIFNALGNIINSRDERRSSDVNDEIYNALDTVYRDVEKLRYSPESPDQVWCVETISRLRLLLKKKRSGN